jgi:A/G-specific adenine glycosylase
MTPPDRAGDFAQAMMDLGATICRPKAPNCPACPLNLDCLARASGNPEAYPARPARRVRPRRHGIAHWAEHNGAVWLVRRPPQGLLGGMAALPGNEWTEAKPAVALTPLARVRHVFTHFALELIVVPANPPAGDGWWQPLGRLDQAGLPTLYRRAAEEVLGGRRQGPETAFRALEEAASPA